MLLMEDHT